MSTLGEENPLIGTVLAGQFRIVRLLGAGGMGSVYLADQLGVGRQVVIKLMLPGLAESSRVAELEERFQREARLVAQLNHPNLVQLYTFGRCENGQLYLAMEFVPGRTLRQVLGESGALAEVRVLLLMDQMCAALHEAHAIGIIHRDLKPDNVMLTQRRDGSDLIKVLDFGIAKPMQQTPDKALTATGAIFGTPQYMAPEQVHARGVDQRTDVYALGLIAYELLAGTPPFEADSAVGIMMKHASARPVPLSERRAGLKLGADTERLIARCLEKDPARRFADMLEMQAALRAARQRLIGQPVPQHTA
jgi:serine/threonine-protein kinase